MKKSSFREIDKALLDAGADIPEEAPFLIAWVDDTEDITSVFYRVVGLDAGELALLSLTLGQAALESRKEH